MVTASHHDASLYINITTGRLVAGVLRVLRKAPIDWCSKKQSSVETSACGSEHSSARAFVEKLLDLHITIKLLGLPLRERRCILRDNDSVVNSSVTSHRKHMKDMWPCHFTMLETPQQLKLFPIISSMERLTLQIF